MFEKSAPARRLQVVRNAVGQPDEALHLSLPGSRNRLDVDVAAITVLDSEQLENLHEPRRGAPGVLHDAGRHEEAVAEAATESGHEQAREAL